MSRLANPFLPTLSLPFWGRVSRGRARTLFPPVLRAGFLFVQRVWGWKPQLHVFFFSSPCGFFAFPLALCALSHFFCPSAFPVFYPDHDRTVAFPPRTTILQSYLPPQRLFIQCFTSSKNISPLFNAPLMPGCSCHLFFYYPEPYPATGFYRPGVRKVPRDWKV